MGRIHIALLGREPLPVYYPLVEDKPDIVYILRTKENFGTSLRLRDAINLLGCRTCLCDVDAFDIKTVIDVCKKIHSGYPPGSEFTYNITGGTKLMAIGAFTIALEYGAKVIYTDSKNYVNLSNFSVKPLACNLNAKAIFALQGQRVKSYSIYKSEPSTLECANEIMKYIMSYGKAHARLTKDYIAWKGHIPNNWTNGNTECVCDSGHVEITVKAESVLNIEHPKVRMLLFEGRWWEILTAQAILKWAKGKYEIWHDVKFQPNDVDPRHPDNDKNEVDLLFGIGNTIVFVECKSGIVTQDNIYKMNFIRETYGSDKSRSVLVSFYPVKKELLEKAKEAKVDVIYGNEKYPALGQIAKRLDLTLNSLKT